MPGAAVVRGDPGDRVAVKSDIANDATSAPRAAASSAYIGIIGRPLGVLLGGAYGMLVGSLFDIDGVETTESVLREILNQVHATRTAVLAQVTEQSPEVIDTAMARLGGEVMRRPVVDVVEEIAAAHEAQREARKETAEGTPRGEQGRRTRQGRRAQVEAPSHQGRRDRSGLAATTSPAPAGRPSSARAIGLERASRVPTRRQRSLPQIVGPVVPHANGGAAANR